LAQKHLTEDVYVDDNNKHTCFLFSGGREGSPSY